MFADAAWTWDEGERQTQHAGSIGAVFFLFGSYYPGIRWDFVWPTSDFHTFPDRPRTQFSIGYNF